jgi:type II secretory pathway component PulM
MRTLRARMAAWWASLQVRERQVLLAGSAAAALILVGGSLLVLGQRLGAAQARVAQKHLDLEFVQAATAEILAAGPLRAAGEAREPLVVLADRAARQAGLTESLAATEAASDGSLRASFRGASFDALAGMLLELSQQSGVAVKSGTVESTGEPGRVNASIVLRAATP